MTRAYTAHLALFGGHIRPTTQAPGRRRLRGLPFSEGSHRDCKHLVRLIQNLKAES